MRKSKRLYYLKAAPTGEWTFSWLLETVRSRLRRLRDRTEPDASGADRVRVLGHIIPFGDGIAGQLSEYEPGGSVALLRLTEDGERLELSAQAPPDRAANYAAGLLYFYAEGNHVVVSQHNRFHKKNLEYHARWLLSRVERHESMFVNTALSLLDVPPARIQETLQRAKKISLPMVRNRRVIDANVPDSVRASSVSAPASTIRELLRMIPALSDGIRLPRGVSIESALEREEVDVEVVFSYNGRVPMEGTVIADAIANAVRNNDDDDIVIELAGQGRIRAGEFRKSTERTVEVDHLGMPDELEMYNVMFNWLQELRILQSVVE